MKRVISMILVAMICLCSWMCVPVAGASFSPPSQERAVWISTDQAAVIKDNGELWLHRADITYATAETGYSYVENAALGESKRLATNAKAVTYLNNHLMVLLNDGKLCGYRFYQGEIYGPLVVMEHVAEVTLYWGASFLVRTNGGELYSVAIASTEFDGMLDAADYQVSKVDQNVVDITNEVYLKRDGVYTLSQGAPSLVKSLDFTGAAQVWKYKRAYFVLTDTGELYSWGLNQGGLLGNGGQYDGFERFFYVGGREPYNTWQPRDIQMDAISHVLSGVKTLWPTVNEVVALMEDGRILCWGDGEPFQVYIDGNLNMGELKVPADMTGYTPREKTPSRWAYYPDGELWQVEFRPDGTFLFAVELERMVEAGTWTASGGGTSQGQEAKPIGQPVLNFVDVNSEDWYALPVMWAVEADVASGTSDNTFSPKTVCTHAEVLTFLWRCYRQAMSFGTPLTTNPYTNSAIEPSKYYYDALLWAYQSGMTDADLNPNAPCSRSETMYYFWAFLRKPDVGDVSTSFTDMPSDPELSYAIGWAVKQGIASGTSDTTFSPNAACTRAEIITFLYRMKHV